MSLGVHIESAKMKKAPFVVRKTMTRPNDTTAYSAGDAITHSTSNPETIAFTVHNAPQGAILTIESAELMRTGTSTDYFEFWLFYEDITATNDNELFELTDADNAKGSGGIIDFEDERDAGNGLRYLVRLTPGYKIKLSDGSRTFYGQLKSMSGHNAEANEEYKIEIKGYVG